MKAGQDFHVFEKWRDAPNYAFGGQDEDGTVPDSDKEAYWRIYSELIDDAEAAIEAYGSSQPLIIRPKPYSRTRGSRGHRPKDLYVSICGADADVLGWYPQVYAIASHRGLEVGFAVSISEEDYFDAKAKARNRSIVPFINSKLPATDDPLTQQLDAVLTEQGGWHVNAKTRLVGGRAGFDAFVSAGELFAHLKTQGEATGGGSICRVYPVASVEGVDAGSELLAALNNFMPLISRCAPTPWDVQIRASQVVVEDLQGDPFDPHGIEDGRLKILAEVRRRQGQAKFRAALLDAYEAQCAISSTKVPDVLQAAHISPYMGPQTNHVTNGLLLRADLHTLFDLGLIRVNPNSMQVSVSPTLKETGYWAYDGQPIRMPEKASARPSTAALAKHFAEAAGKS